ncbi:MAG: PfkB family carbohydrate kinase [Candidatus Eremiobacterota bacterium]
MKLYKKFDVIAIGGVAWDYIGIVNKYPGAGEKAEISFLEQQGGGQAGTAIVTAARLGGTCAVTGITGDDETGDKIRQSLSEEGVDVSRLFIDKGATSHIAFCFTHSGERTIFYNRGNKRLLSEKDIDGDFIKNCSCLLTDVHHSRASLEAVRIARKENIPVVTDIERDAPENDEIFSLATHNILPVKYLLTFTEEEILQKAVKLWHEKFPSSILVVTLGEEGSLAYNGEKIIRQTAYRVSPVVDTTGAGDVVHGAFARGITLGYSLEKNLEFASLIAGLKCRSLGGRKGIPRAEQLNGLWNI